MRRPQWQNVEYVPVRPIDLLLCFDIASTQANVFIGDPRNCLDFPELELQQRCNPTGGVRVIEWHAVSGEECGGGQVSSLISANEVVEASLVADDQAGEKHGTQAYRK